jgi:hypothetical protein
MKKLIENLNFLGKIFHSKSKTTRIFNLKHIIKGLKAAFHALLRYRTFPYYPRILAHIDDSNIIFFKYAYTLNNKILIDSAKSRHQPRMSKIVGRQKEVDIVIDWNRYLTKTIYISKLPEHELQSALPYQLASQSPFNPNEILYCIRNSAESSNNQTRISVDYSDSNRPNSRISQIRDFYLFPENIYSEHHIWEAFAKNVISQDKALIYNRILYIVLDDSSALLGILNTDSDIASKRISLDYASRSWIESLENAMVSYLASFQSKSSSHNIENLLIFDQYDRAGEFMDSLLPSFSAPAKIFSIDNEFEKNTGLRIISENTTYYPLSIYAYLMLGAKKQLQIQPRETLNKPFLNTYLVSNLKNSAIYILLLLVLLPFLFYAKIQNYSSQLEQLNTRISETSPMVNRLSDINDELDKYKDLTRDRNDAIDILYLVSSDKPNDIHYVSITYSNSNRMSLKGTADNPASPVQYVKLLQKLDICNNADLKYITQKGIQDKSHNEFLIELSLKDD